MWRKDRMRESSYQVSPGVDRVRALTFFPFFPSFNEAHCCLCECLWWEGLAVRLLAAKTHLCCLILLFNCIYFVTRPVSIHTACLCSNKMVILTENHEEQDYILIEERKCSSLPSSPAKRVSPTKKKQFYINQAIRNSDLTPRAKGKKSLRRQENSKLPRHTIRIENAVIYCISCPTSNTYMQKCTLSFASLIKEDFKSVSEFVLISTLRLSLPSFVLWKPARFLANLLERDECSKDDLEVCSNPSIPSIFTEACTNGNFIEPWNDFMNCSGEEQERLLSLLEQDEAKKKTLSRLLKDPRNVNPAFTAQECFQRIDRRLRATLKRKQIPMGTLEVLEENLLSFFNTQPRSVYTTNLASSFERLLLHAVCQYMDLVSASTNYDGSRQTEVVNKQEEFLPPTLQLSAYLEQMS
uniref:R3H domain containing 4 n=1 Tax=Scophthalmus maximus TaxID=52904 RepID=A0A8D3DG28_SCOMX